MEDVSVLIAKSQAGERDAREVLIETNLDWYTTLSGGFQAEGRIWKICFR